MQLSPILTDNAALGELGHRFMQTRLQRNMTQAELAERAGVSKRTVERLEEGGSSQFANVIKVIRALELFDGLERLLPEPGPSPIQQVRLQGRQRKRASGSSPVNVAKGTTKNAGKPWTWGSSR